MLASVSSHYDTVRPFLLMLVAVAGGTEHSISTCTEFLDGNSPPLVLLQGLAGQVMVSRPLCPVLFGHQYGSKFKDSEDSLVQDGHAISSSLPMWCSKNVSWISKP